MIFFFNYLFSIGYAYLLGWYYAHRRLSDWGLFLLLLPIFAVWLFICGGQYEVGTDYTSYLSIFYGNDLDTYIDKHEYIFVGIVSLFNTFGIYGQALFYFFYALNFLFLFLIIKRLNVQQIFIFIILYITVTNLFNNQLNTLRQATAVYIGTYVAILILEERFRKGLLFILLAVFIHQSALVLLCLYGLNYIIKRLSYNILLICLFIAIGLSIVLKTDVLEFALSFLSEEYAWYLKGGMVEETGLLTKVTKYLFIPVYLLAWVNFRKNNYNDEMLLFKWGWIAFCCRISVMNLSIINRLFDYFLILSVFPLLLYLYHLFKTRKNLLFVSIIFLFSLFYAIKVIIFARGEYLYNSIYF